MGKKRWGVLLLFISYLMCWETRADFEAFKCCYQFPIYRSSSCNKKYERIKTPEFFTERGDSEKKKAICELWNALFSYKVEDSKFAPLFYKLQEDSALINVDKEETAYKNYLGKIDHPKNGVFYWPNQTEPNEMKVRFEDFSKTVKTRLGDITHSPAGMLWSGLGRVQNIQSVAQLTKALLKDPTLSIEKRRDRYCDLIRENSKRTFFECQIGNCGEGSEVGYCLAHMSGFKDLLVCHSRNDHKFTIYLDRDQEQICVLDRWDDLKKGHTYCGIQFKKGKALFHPNGAKENKLAPTKSKWFRKISCRDPLNESSLRVLESDRELFDYQRWVSLIKPLSEN